MEGGGVATDSLDFADDLRAIRSHGWSRDRSDVKDWTSQISSTDSKFLFVTTGFNIRPMEIQAAIGVSQIVDIDKFIAKRRLIAKKVRESLQGTRLSLIDGGCLSGQVEESAHSWMLLALRIESHEADSWRGLILEKLNKLEIETRPILTGNFLEQPAIRRIRKDLPPASDFEIATKISRSGFMVGAHHDFTRDQIEFLAQSLRSIALELN
jgi:CDP-6-deoxy-D-xylo-4-hexulose-3-dehydrase